MPLIKYLNPAEINTRTHAALRPGPHIQTHNPSSQNNSGRRDLWGLFFFQMSSEVHTHTHTHTHMHTLTVHLCLGSFSYPEILLFFFILTDAKLTLCVCVGRIWRVIVCYWFSFQCDCAVETEIQAQVGSDPRLSYCVCHDVECAVWLLWLDVVFLPRGASYLHRDSCNCFLLRGGSCAETAAAAVAAATAVCWDPFGLFHLLCLLVCSKEFATWFLSNSGHRHCSKLEPVTFHFCLNPAPFC